jgi:class 3 adenylate cyclase/predicted ATPase
LQCPNCRAETAKGGKFCIACGSALASLCAACGGSNPAGATFCADCGALLIASKRTDTGRSASSRKAGRTLLASPIAERRQLTVIFCDLVGSTALASRLDLEDLRAVIGAYQRCCAEVIERAGGFIAKYMGDGVLAYFGYPKAHEDDAERAVRAGLALIEAAGELHADGRPLQVRIGIATGLVVVGDLLGEGAAQEQAVIGEAPNLAARLQALAKPGAVVIASNTRRLLGGLFEYRESAPVALKGSAKPVSAFQVLGPSTVESRFEARQEGGAVPLVGRTEELDLLLRLWQDAKAGSGRAVLISGEPGIGKSRLAAALLEATSDAQPFRICCFCLPHHQDSAFHPFKNYLQRVAAFRRDDRPETKLAKLEALLGHSNATDDEIALIAELLSLPHPGSERLAGLSPQRRKEKTCEAILAQAERLAAQRPVLMIYEDAHWIDPTSLELLKLLVARIARQPVLLLLTARPEFAPPWACDAHVTTLALTRLGRPHAAALVERLTSSKTLPPDVLEQILARTDGVPLFVEELTKAVLESELLREEAGRYVLAGPLPPLAIPTTLHDSLMARLDRLAPMRDIVQVGAALGREFSYELLRAIQGLPDDELNEALRELVRSELVFCRGVPPEAVYTFKHALVQDAAYGMMLRSRRQQLHARIVAVLEGEFPDIVAAQPERVGQHCAEAGLRKKAIEYWLAAGRQALARSTTAEAVALLHKCLGLLPHVADGAGRDQCELDLQIALGQALSAAHGYAAPGADQAYARARELCERLDRPAQLVPILYGQFLLHLHRTDMEWVRRHGEETCQRGEASQNVVLQWLGSRMCGTRLGYLGEFTAARAYLERSLILSDGAERTGDAALPPEGPKVGVLFHLCRVLCCLGYVDQALLRLEELMAEARQRPPLALLVGLGGACIVDWCLRSASPTSLQRADQLLAVSVEQGFAQGRAWAGMFRGWCLAAMGRPDEGVPLLTSGLSDFRALGITGQLPMFLTARADAYAMAGQPEAGLEQLAEAHNVAQATQNRWAAAETLRQRGALLLATDNRSAAEASFREALALARQQEARLWELRTVNGLARLWRDQGKRTEAHELLAPVHAWFTESVQTADLIQAKELLDELEVQREPAGADLLRCS